MQVSWSVIDGTLTDSVGDAERKSNSERSLEYRLQTRVHVTVWGVTHVARVCAMRWMCGGVGHCLGVRMDAVDVWATGGGSSAFGSLRAFPGGDLASVVTWRLARRAAAFVESAARRCCRLPAWAWDGRRRRQRRIADTGRDSGGDVATSGRAGSSRAYRAAEPRTLPVVTWRLRGCAVAPGCETRSAVVSEANGGRKGVVLT